MKRLLYASIFKVVTTLLLICLLFIPCVSVVAVTHKGSGKSTYHEDMDGKSYHVMSVDDAEDWAESEEYRYVRLGNLNERLHLDLSKNEGLGRSDLEKLSLFQVYLQMVEEVDRQTEMLEKLQDTQEKINDLDISASDKSELMEMTYIGFEQNAESIMGSAVVSTIGWIVAASLIWRLIDGIVMVVTAKQGMTVGIKTANIEKTEAYVLKKTRRSYYKPVWTMVALILYLAFYGVAMQGMYVSAMGNSKYMSMYSGLCGCRVLVEPFLNPLVWLLVFLVAGILTNILVNRYVRDDVILYQEQE